jgi:hypothetical protein
MNLATAFLCSREAVRNMRLKAAGGRIVNVGSRAAVVATGFSVAYTSSKAAVGAMVRALADELVDERILVNAVLPGTIDTPANRGDAARRSRQVDEARRHRGGDRLAGVAGADGHIGRADSRRLDLSQKGLRPLASGKSVRDQRDVVDADGAGAGVHERERDAALTSAFVVMKLCVKVSRLLFRLSFDFVVRRVRIHGQTNLRVHGSRPRCLEREPYDVLLEAPVGYFASTIRLRCPRGW